MRHLLLPPLEFFADLTSMEAEVPIPHLPLHLLPLLLVAAETLTITADQS